MVLLLSGPFAVDNTSKQSTFFFSYIYEPDVTFSCTWWLCIQKKKRVTELENHQQSLLIFFSSFNLISIHDPSRSCSHQNLFNIFVSMRLKEDESQLSGMIMSPALKFFIALFNNKLLYFLFSSSFYQFDFLCFEFINN